ncbi:hypothetical protein AAHE18_08G214800 [Arachis hypogaea]
MLWNAALLSLNTLNKYNISGSKISLFTKASQNQFIFHHSFMTFITVHRVHSFMTFITVHSSQFIKINEITKSVHNSFSFQRVETQSSVHQSTVSSESDCITKSCS